jgi:hypothetical protein
MAPFFVKMDQAEFGGGVDRQTKQELGASLEPVPVERPRRGRRADTERSFLEVYRYSYPGSSAASAAASSILLTLFHVAAVALNKFWFCRFCILLTVHGPV